MIMERVDKLISSQGKYTRSEVKKLIREGRVTIDGKTVTRPETKADADSQVIAVDGETLGYKKHLYIMLNKPKGVISASRDGKETTVVDLVPVALQRNGLFPAGRLDGDTTGFVLITDDGDFAHRILSPKNHIQKTYHAELAEEITEETIAAFRNGVELSDGTLCLEAELRSLGGRQAEIKICEGKYHQVKRMFAALGNKVLALKRTAMGNLPLDESLAPGECRELTREELAQIEGK
ncbi:MAG: pseudouridine synthase [Oscillospiraceae bacterium]|nr:pseudouridine synthase [Oscillospiraceae bacterium]